MSNIVGIWDYESDPKKDLELGSLLLMAAALHPVGFEIRNGRCGFWVDNLGSDPPTNASHGWHVSLLFSFTNRMVSGVHLHVCVLFFCSQDRETDELPYSLFWSVSVNAEMATRSL